MSLFEKDAIGSGSNYMNYMVTLDNWSYFSHIEFDHRKSKFGPSNSFKTAERFFNILT